MTLAILSAMEEELSLYRETCTVTGATERAGRTIYEAEHAGHTLALIQTGVGKVSAAMATQLALDVVAPDAVLCTGTAGALHDGLGIGDIVVAEDCLQHDLRVDFLGLPPGQVPFTDLRVFETDETLRAVAQAIDLAEHPVRTGRVLTGDTFVQDEAARQVLRDDLGGDCVEMEGAAVGQVCVLNAVPFLLVRAISDRADGSSDVAFQAFLTEAAHASARLVLRLLNRLDTDTHNAFHDATDRGLEG